MRTLAHGAADFLYPPVCRLCAAELPESPSGVGLQAPFCEKCRGELLATRGLACIRCGAAIGPYLDPNIPCSMCRDERFAFQRVIRVGVYDGALRSACLKSKTPGSEALAAGMAELLWDCEAETLKNAKADVVVPVPHHWVRRFYRPHNTAETLGQVWGARLNVPFAPHILQKCRWTRPQARLSPTERRANLRSAFRAVPAEGLAGATVLLADDVMTTGTTAHETAKVLIGAGAARVVVAVVARGLGRRY
jgi:predicted amidophosphoribosyltransferase